MHKLQLHPLVKSDFIEAAAYYKNISPEQLQRFITELKEAYQSIQRSPAHYLVLIKSRNVRRISLKSFDYSVIYAIKKEMIIVLAIKHHRQRNYWKNRK
jgi:plasmid stabilization system protein ParE